MKRCYKSLCDLRIWGVLLLCGAALNACSQNQQDSSTRDPGDRMLKCVQELSSPAYEGRGVNSPGLDKAAGFIRGEMERLQLQPAGDDGFYQAFEISINVKPLEGTRLRILENGDGIWYEPGHIWAPEGISADAQLEDLAVRIHPDGLGSSDGSGHPGGTGHPGSKLPEPFAILILERETPAAQSMMMIPPWQLNPWGYLVEQAIHAEAAGAKALFVSSDPWNSIRTEEVSLPNPSDGYVTAPIPVVRFSPSRVRELLEMMGADAATASRLAGSTLAGSEQGQIRVDLNIAMDRTLKSPRNVIGSIPGNGEWVFVTAHYDHLGRGDNAPSGEFVYYPGADDNASGIALLLELASRFSQQHNKSKRGLVFAAFAAEEIGLAGSRYLADHPIVPLGDVATVVNVDMVGRLRDGDLLVMGTGSGTLLAEIVDSVRTVATPGLALRSVQDPGSPSDQAPFYAKGVPVLHIMTPPHVDYHQPTDTWDKIDTEGLCRVTDFTFALVDSLRSSARPAFRTSASGMAAPRSGGSYTVYLGTIPDFAYEGDDGVRLSGVKPDSPAASAGLLEGDLLIEVGGLPLKNLRDYVSILKAHKPGDEVELVFRRSGTEQRVKTVFEERK
ncbi:MAG: M20/M25/M40 family metallo-hydrolase [Candidatus Eisenbacteria bacterium]|uniref:M20/M25/M40 family metallo-hydrolase n=1 Tax=Eiseniibacteriota bacterium TaxID=2212470 RepID=A0A948RS75_UNCEI|nr:M20/M25/M40 family metallo-hydrolase [Candidatus Eisenbacteria bacterium]MBU1947129.1 M20/M25/M40 family metallo-hydrolase [Candidatus Eisenbacteria bacterium]MBU2689895.1 M20/M25/M40 family metallo-hydrolase [Candidatus Eisenbacteria bacterium]